MKKTLVAGALVAMCSAAFATVGNNGGGHGTCGVGQQTNGCPGNGGTGGTGGTGGNASAGALAGATSGSVSASNASTGPITNTNTANGGQGGTGIGGSSTANGGNASQGQGQGQQQSNRSNNQNSVTGGDQRNTSTNNIAQGQSSDNRNTTSSNSSQNASTQSGVAGSGNSTNGIALDVSDKSSNTYIREGDRTLFIPSVVPATPPSSVASANVIKETSACGPLQSVVKREIHGVFFGVFGGQDIVKQGFTEELAPYRDETGNVAEYIVRPSTYGDRKVFGHQVTQYTAVIGISGARNFAIGGGGGTSQNWGQAGTGTSSANQQMVTTIQLRLCEVGTVRQEKPVQPALIEVSPKVLGQ